MADQVSVLVVVAHPDDESFFMGGTIAKMVREGALVHVVALSDGVGSRPDGDADAAARRARHFAEACGILGATHQLLSVFRDQQSDVVSQLSINQEVEKVFCDVEPSIVFTHHPGDLNVDHRRVAEAVFVSARGRHWLTLMTMTPEWPELCVGMPWLPTMQRFLEIELRDQKAAACARYVEEVRPYPHPRSAERIQSEQYERFREIR